MADQNNEERAPLLQNTGPGPGVPPVYSPIASTGKASEIVFINFVSNVMDMPKIE